MLGVNQKIINGVDTDGKYIFVLNADNKLKCIGTGNSGTELGREYKEIEIGKANKEEITENKPIQILGMFCTTFPLRRVYIVHQLYSSSEKKQNFKHSNKHEQNNSIEGQPLINIYDSDSLELVEQVYDLNDFHSMNRAIIQQISSSSSSQEQTTSNKNQNNNKLNNNGTIISGINLGDVFEEAFKLTGRYEFVRKYLLSAQKREFDENDQENDEDQDLIEEREISKEYKNIYGQTRKQKLPWQQNNLSKQVQHSLKITSSYRFFSDGQFVYYLSTILHSNQEAVEGIGKVDEQFPVFALLHVYDPDDWKLIRTHLLDLRTCGDRIQCQLCHNNIQDQRYFTCKQCRSIGTGIIGQRTLDYNPIRDIQRQVRNVSNIIQYMHIYV
ncbi:MAG: hypothetical protein EZS28_023705 [Streblomastix strix]|uniref:Uncharacterized protein n=1 Tax=Streblomastix strix TaxID=222440 RepID=A0A5J4VEB6_9EUKA|nr:MAG: hypothetical protein EZS28_023705 [Streblomastix strix]